MLNGPAHRVKSPVAPLQRLVAAGCLPPAPLAPERLPALRCYKSSIAPYSSFLLFLPGEKLQPPFLVRFLSSPASARPAASRPPPSFHAGPRKRSGAPRPHQLPRAASTRPKSSFSPPPFPAPPPLGEYPSPAVFSSAVMCLTFLDPV
jgi:hypothetical protein